MEVDALLVHLTETSGSVDAIMLTAVRTGLQVSEMTALTVENVNPSVSPTSESSARTVRNGMCAGQ